MPEPPKITTSLAERIAKLNSNKSHGQQSDKGQTSTSPLGPIKSKISRYEASAVNEAPLIPKGSFGLGAPLTKPERGLDRIRIASLGVSGGEQPKLLLDAVVGQNHITRIPGTPRSLSAGSKHHDSQESPSQEELSQRLRVVSLDETGIKASDKQLLASKHSSASFAEDSRAIAQIREAKDSDRSSEVYDGILESYPSAPADESDMEAPRVSCVDCSELVDLDMLADHVCKPRKKSETQGQGQEKNPSPDASQGLPIPSDVPVDAGEEEVAEEGVEDGREEDPTNDYEDQPLDVLPTKTDGHQNQSYPSSETGITDDVTPDVGSNSQQPPTDQSSPRVTPGSDPTTTPESKSSTRQSETSSTANRFSSSSSSSSTSTSTSQTSRSTKSSSTTNHEEVNSAQTMKKLTPPPPPQSASPDSKKKSWYDDDDDEDLVECTGYATIVSYSQRF